jgi:hypothetical protein
MTESITDVSNPAAPRRVATGHSVHVTVDVEARRAVDIPQWLLGVLEAFQGGCIPMNR